jgi:putative glutamine amidotransferase
MNAPLILVAPGTQRQGPEFEDYSLTLSAAYPRALMQAGAIPWILPGTTPHLMLRECVQRCHGVLLTGGDDVQPELYTDQLAKPLRRTVGAVDPARDLAEIRLIQEVFRQRKPLLAICRGQQILHVAFGGALIVDLRQEVGGAIDHDQMKRKDHVAHEVELAKDSFLFRLFGQRVLGVNSTHHQAVRAVVSPFRAAAISPDGVIEAIELGLAERHLLPYLVAVQFHPERLIRQYPEFLEIFRSFTRACASAKKRSI